MNEPRYSGKELRSGPAAQCRDVVKIYRTKVSVVRALERIDMDVQRSTIVSLFGPSGSGKSSLGRIVAGIDLPDSGDVSIDGEQISMLGPRARRRLRRTKIGFVFADPAHNLLPYLDALQHIEMALELRGSASGRAGGRRRKAGATDLLDSLGLGHRYHHRPAQLSGGEQQRLSVASAISGDPSIVVLDEPTAELDRSSATVLLDHLVSLKDNGTTFVVSSHDPAVAEVSDQVVRLSRGERVG